METVEFVSSLEKICPSTELLVSIGFSDEEAREFQGTYIAISKGHNSSHGGSFYSRLIAEYDISKIVIGMVEFCLEPVEKMGLLHIASLESDKVVIDKNDEVFVNESGSGTRLWECSATSDKFFAALLLLAEHFTSCLSDDSRYEDIEAAQTLAHQAAKLAGGDEYLRFYQMMLAV